MTNSNLKKAQLAKSLVGKKVMFSSGVGVVFSFVVDGGDYETNHHISITVKTPDNQYLSMNPENVKVLNDEDYSDCVYLSYGIELAA